MQSQAFSQATIEDLKKKKKRKHFKRSETPVNTGLFTDLQEHKKIVRLYSNQTEC